MVPPHLRAPAITKDQRHNNPIGHRNVWRRGMMGTAHFFDPHGPNCMNFGIAKLAERGQEILNNIIKKTQQSTVWIDSAGGLHGMAGTYPSCDGNACEPRHLQF
mmetsp:Transcript_4742/g.10746  ORF Transcript_4742/g.10746 Transcript_4742/m.10746 type:complete len:104 (-) Transcript_4742:172-483(-)